MVSFISPAASSRKTISGIWQHHTASGQEGCCQHGDVFCSPCTYVSDTASPSSQSIRPQARMPFLSSACPPSCTILCRVGLRSMVASFISGEPDEWRPGVSIMVKIDYLPIHNNLLRTWFFDPRQSHRLSFRDLCNIRFCPNHVGHPCRSSRFVSATLVHAIAFFNMAAPIQGVDRSFPV